ncbi:MULTISPECIES: SDR family oxidoreductase [unclassified Bradyrhizobium]|uniref:SDR family oxidoreductase n=1 Tax=unclassified Bradyrhizobium TaxID=2631580 RepID=UPI0029166784|nr:MULTISPECIES: SDR family oxidoreductase [unclassified Bradyrhizobium]
MKIVVVGGTGRIGTKLAGLLRRKGYDVVQASPRTGVDAVTGDGLDFALSGADVVVDVANSPSFEDGAVLEFFTRSTRNVLAAEIAARLQHHVALSIVGTDRLPDCGYFRGKLAQERLIRNSGRRYSILRATQFYEFADDIVATSTHGQVARLSPALFQPVAADDVAAALAAVTLAPPIDGIIELAGPEQLSLDDFGRRYLAAINDPRKVVADIHARYFGAELDDRSLTPGDHPRLGVIRFADWLSSLRQ